jgi:methyl-accepting chemotaxis protein
VGLARKAYGALTVMLLGTLGMSGLVFVQANQTSGHLHDYRAVTSALEARVAAMRADFFAYDDQMNMFVAVLLDAQLNRGGRADGLDLETRGQADAARAAMHENLDAARELTVRAHHPGNLPVALTDIERALTDFDEYADRTLQLADAGNLRGAVGVATRDNLETSTALMQALDDAQAAVTFSVNEDLADLELRQGRLRLLAVVAAVVVALMVAALATGTRLGVLRPLGALRARVLAIANGTVAVDDPAAHLPESGDEELAAVSRAFNTMLDSIRGRDAELATAHAEREAHLAATFEQQRAAEKFVRLRAQSIIDETATSVMSELGALAEHVDAVRKGAGAIESRVTATEVVTRSVVADTRSADQDVAALGDSLREVASMATLIAGVAEQTKLLALNATIEAARAGSAGQGFSVVATEVKGLATTAADSTERISATLATLESDAGRVGQAITTVGSNIGTLDDATAALTQVAAQQFEAVAHLDEALATAIVRVQEMGTLTERLERRAAERHAVTGEALLEIAGNAVTARLVDISATGVRCALSGPRPRSLAPGAVVRATLTIDDSTLRITGCVARATDSTDPTEVGIHFTEVSARDRLGLERILDGLLGPVLVARV